MKKIYSFLMLLVMTAMCVTASAKTFTITVDDQNHIGQVMITNTYTYLTFVDNKVEFEAEDSHYLMIRAASGYLLASVEDGNGNSLAAITPTDNVQFQLSELGESSTIVITTSEKEKKIFTFTGDERLTVGYNYGTYQYYAEDGVFTVPMGEDYSSVQISSDDPALAVKKVVSDSGNEHWPMYGTVNIYSYEYDESTHFTIETYNPEEARTASMTVKVNGDAEDVRFERSSDYMELPLKSNGDTIIKFNPEVETYYSVRHAVYNKNLYQVKINGTAIEPYYGTFNIEANDGDYIEITPAFPDVDVPITFAFTNEGTEGVISYMTIDNQNVENWKDENLTVKLGSSVSVGLNREDYDITSFVVNGDIQYGYSYEAVVTSEDGLEFVITASKKAPKHVTINCENYEGIVVYKGSSYMGETYELTGPTTEIVVAPSIPYIQIEQAQNWVISYIEDNNGNTYTTSDYITVSDGMELFVGANKLERDRNLTVYVGDGEWTYRSITLSNHNYDIRVSYTYNMYEDGNTLPVGYTNIAFADFDCPIVINGAAGSDYSRPIVYLNDQLCEYNNNYYTYDGLDGELQDGDVLKMFPAEPAKYMVTYTVDDADIEVVHDHSHAIGALDAAVVYTVLEGTEVWIKPVADSEIVVTVNGQDVAANEEGIYAFAINEDTTVKVESNVANGILDLNAKVAADTDVYNLQGIRVGRASDASRLPAGIYIINGQKVRF